MTLQSQQIKAVLLVFAFFAFAPLRVALAAGDAPHLYVDISDQEVRTRIAHEGQGRFVSKVKTVSEKPVANKLFVETADNSTVFAYGSAVRIESCVACRHFSFVKPVENRSVSNIIERGYLQASELPFAVQDHQNIAGRHFKRMVTLGQTKAIKPKADPTITHAVFCGNINVLHLLDVNHVVQLFSRRAILNVPSGVGTRPNRYVLIIEPPLDSSASDTVKHAHVGSTTPLVQVQLFKFGFSRWLDWSGVYPNLFQPFIYEARRTLIMVGHFISVPASAYIKLNEFNTWRSFCFLRHSILQKRSPSRRVEADQNSPAMGAASIRPNGQTIRGSSLYGLLTAWIIARIEVNNVPSVFQVVKTLMEDIRALVKTGKVPS